VATESKIFHLQMDADARLAAAAGGVVRHLGNLAGLENAAIARLQSAVIAACRAAFENLTGDRAQLKVTFTLLPDRIEVALAHRGEALPAVGLDTIAGFVAPGAAGALDPSVFDGFDRVQYETHDGETVTRLTKYLGGASSSA
jgi:hypothetical protein